MQKRDLLLSPLFIVGAPRSGTTWLQNLMLESNYVFGGQESYFYSLFHPAFVSVSDDSDKRRVGLSSYWSEDDFRKQMHEVWINTFKSLCTPESKLLLEKTPFHALYVDKLADFLPNAKFIHLIRDSRAVTASLIAASKGWGDYWAPKKTKSAALEWYRHVKSAKYCDLINDPSRFMEVHYEDLLAAPVPSIIKIFEFSGLPIDEKEIEQAVLNQSFSKRKQIGNVIPGVKSDIAREPEGFMRRGTADSWRSDLNFYQKLVVWRYTRKLMKEVGYNWKGRMISGH